MIPEGNRLIGEIPGWTGLSQITLCRRRGVLLTDELRPGSQPGQPDCGRSSIRFGIGPGFRQAIILKSAITYTGSNPAAQVAKTAIEKLFKNRFITHHPAKSSRRVAPPLTPPYVPFRAYGGFR
jgi:hypothetical protein